MFKIVRVPEVGKAATPIEVDDDYEFFPKKVDFSEGYSLVASVTDTLGANVVFDDGDVDATANTITVTAHGLQTGWAIVFATDGTLPAPLVAATTYYAIRVSADVFKVATTYANALATTAIDLSDTGTGNDTVTVTGTFRGTMKLQVSNNCWKDNVGAAGLEMRSDVVWADLPSSEVTLDGGDETAVWNVRDVFYETFRLVFVWELGSADIATYFVAKGNG
jgi:hypothetical protein